MGKAQRIQKQRNVASSVYYTARSSGRSYSSVRAQADLYFQRAAARTPQQRRTANEAAYYGATGSASVPSSSSAYIASTSGPKNYPGSQGPRGSAIDNVDRAIKKVLGPRGPQSSSDKRELDRPTGFNWKQTRSQNYGVVWDG